MKRKGHSDHHLPPVANA